MISVDAIRNASSALHVSNVPIVKAIGLYVLRAMGDILGSDIPVENYVLTLDGKDLFLGKEIISLGRHQNEKIKLNKNGSVYVVKNDQLIQEVLGVFVISIGGKKHSQIIYYDKQNQQWMQFNNQTAEKNVPPPQPLSEDNLIDMSVMMIIGLFDTKPMTINSNK